MSFLVESLRYMMDKESILIKIEAIVDWQPIADNLKVKLSKEVMRGQVPYDYLSLFKVLLLQQWHQLSDPKMEEALHTRIDFMWFTGFGLADKEMLVPDETTICRFRNKLVKKDMLEGYLKQINHQLEQHNLKVKITEGAILDATLIEAAVNSQAKPKLIAEDRNEDDIDNSGSGGELFELSANQQSNVEIDSDAKWLKKGKRNIFGFKEFIVTDATDGYYEHLMITPANQSEMTSLEQVLQPVIEEAAPKFLQTDKGYSSEANREFLKINNIGNGIMDKAKRNTKLTFKQLYRNKRISKTRYIVERTNATTKNIFGFTRSKYIGIAKVKTQALLVAIAHNLLKAGNKISLTLNNSIQILRKRQISWVF